MKEEIILFNKIEKLMVGENWVLKKVDIDISCPLIQIKVNKWDLKKIIIGNKESSPLEKIYCISKEGFSTILVTIFFDKDVLKMFHIKKFSRFKLQIPCTKKLLTLKSKYSLLGNYELYVDQEDCIELYKDISHNAEVLLFYDNPLGEFSNKSILHSTLNNVLSYHEEGTGFVREDYRISIINSKSDILEMNILLTKPEVGFLIGEQGHRIEKLRESSNATIQILPIAKRFRLMDILCPDSINQQISIVGDVYSVALGIASVESLLILHKWLPRKHL
ncbi:Mer1p NDAI_0F03630 [Naumovozyma dairenensis CBS 421]|uniref:K Homology domain-containing protein n=1 Tax=Naumovozyma dairenensis (strain ATCC 10597 / BCRC 20456 / CBS 421 / NBRC 0211 / NRRL Y-12639) TaxID=1071378 RepID=G0WD20_NAUDC|nr:hypothetical protein NDAI_0F03630 [Naumovozyma dairenensis CBS 421]CCD25681.1 hypothetical protein NDAI_0F03630 [Naumovozyma dairenensis CBS 421]